MKEYDFFPAFVRRNIENLFGVPHQKRSPVEAEQEKSPLIDVADMVNKEKQKKELDKFYKDKEDKKKRITQNLERQFENIDSQLEAAARRGAYNLEIRAHLDPTWEWGMTRGNNSEKEKLVSSITYDLQKKIKTLGVKLNSTCPEFDKFRRCMTKQGKEREKSDCQTSLCIVTASWKPE